MNNLKAIKADTLKNLDELLVVLDLIKSLDDFNDNFELLYRSLRTFKKSAQDLGSKESEEQLETLEKILLSNSNIDMHLQELLGFLRVELKKLKSIISSIKV